MGIFSRFRDIVSANINGLLDKAEDPEKMIKQIIREMEDTLVEIKASCAGAIASRTRTEREVEQLRERVDGWAKRAEMAVAKGREDLAREALMEKRSLKERLDGQEEQLQKYSEIVSQYRKDIEELEAKRAEARKKYQVLLQRHIHAQRKSRAQKDIRKANDTDAFVKFERFEQRIDRLEADADLINPSRPDLDTQFRNLETDEEIEKELAALRERGKDQQS